MHSSWIHSMDCESQTYAQFPIMFACRIQLAVRSITTGIWSYFFRYLFQ